MTLMDWAKLLDPDGSIADIVELLGLTNEILEDAQFMEGNLETGHRVTVRTGLPEVYWRLLNQPVPTSSSRSAQVDEKSGMLEAWNEVDKDLAMLNGNAAEYRLQEGKSFLEAMNQEMASTLIYGNSSVSPEEFTGFAPRYSDTTAANGRNILDAGGVGSDNSSIWLIVWGADTVFKIFPKGSKSGLQHMDHGEQTSQTGVGGTDTTPGRMRVLQEQWQWKCGLVVKDWRYVVRIANIDISELDGGAGAADLTELMTKAIHRIPSIKNGKAAFYMNRSCRQYLDLQRRADVKDGGQLDYRVVDGKLIPFFREVPIRLVDALTETEQQVL